LGRETIARRLYEQGLVRIEMHKDGSRRYFAREYVGGKRARVLVLTDLNPPESGPIGPEVGKGPEVPEVSWDRWWGCNRSQDRSLVGPPGDRSESGPIRGTGDERWDRSPGPGKEQAGEVEFANGTDGTAVFSQEVPEMSASVSREDF
jgi:hypothetical protein